MAVYFYPEPGAYDFRYFEAPNASIDPNDFTQYNEKKMEIQPMFNGYLQRFYTHYHSRETWVVVTYLTPKKLRISYPIRIKVNSKPTVFDPDLVSIMSFGKTALFEWEDGPTNENDLYLSIVSDEKENLISATYTDEPWFEFYDTRNVVINLRDIPNMPQLVPGEEYQLTIMGVSKHHQWVNLMARKWFTARN